MSRAAILDVAGRLLPGKFLQRYVVEDVTYLLLHIDPDRMYIAGCVTGAFPLVDDAPVGDDRTFYRLDHFKQRDLVCWTAENEPSAGAAIRFDQTDFAELLEDLRQEGRRDINGGCDVA